MKHNIVHEEIVNGIVYKIIEDKDIDSAIDFYFDVFLRGNYISMIILLSSFLWCLKEIIQKWRHKTYRFRWTDHSLIWRL